MEAFFSAVKNIIRILAFTGVFLVLCLYPASRAHATGNNGLQTGETDISTVIDPPGTYDAPEDLNTINTVNRLTITYNDDNGSLNSSLRILITLTLIAIAPLLLMVMTSFTRVIIVLHFTRAALNTQTAPPNQVLVALSLILTFFIMQPTIEEINVNAVIPFEAGTIDQDEFLEKAMTPLRNFMEPQTQVKDVRLFYDIAGMEWDGTLESIPNSILIPAFMISELRIAFWIGFMIYIPFIIIDMVVASVLMSMGMMMLPPTTISMPFKILLFILADGWSLIIGQLVRTFY
ncbi:MAG: flagellar type III secretion system pore protein FliP [Lachnospiraceae bacterium]|nr:flagellar type III secretion system pore protein FliP [Lachnospiraceae bacterium]